MNATKMKIDSMDFLVSLPSKSHLIAFIIETVLNASYCPRRETQTKVLCFVSDRESIVATKKTPSILFQDGRCFQIELNEIMKTN